MTREPIHYFSLIIFLFILLSVKTYADENLSTSDLVYSFFQADCPFIYPETRPRIALTSSFSADYYEWFPDSMKSGTGIFQYGLFAAYARSFKNIRTTLNGNLNFGYRSIEDLFFSGYASQDWKIRHLNYSFIASLDYKKNSVSFKLQSSNIGLNDVNVVSKFPRSEDNQTENRYFWDLFKNTFNDTQSFHIDSSPLVYQIQLQHEWKPGYSVLLSMSAGRGPVELFEYHRNTNNDSRIRGERETVLSADYNPVILNAGLKTGYSLFWAGLSFVETHPLWKQNVYPETHDIEILSSGRLVGDSWQFGVRNGNDYGPQLMIMMGQGNYEWEGFLKTPVLGYTAFGILPISHEMASEGEFYYQMQRVRIRISGNFFNISVTPSISYMHARAGVNMHNNANLQFGLTSIDDDKKIAWQIHLFESEINTCIQLGKQYSLTLKVKQKIPYIQTVLRTGWAEPVEPLIKTKSYGGGFISATLSWYKKPI